ncbi:MAG: hypothetical protein ACRDZ4_11185 [Egibacteraceae bacterium]
MLPNAGLPVSLTGLLTVFGDCFTAPTFTTFTALVTGFVRQTAAHTVCGMLTGAGLERVWHHSRARRCCRCQQGGRCCRTVRPRASAPRRPPRRPGVTVRAITGPRGLRDRGARP